MADGRDEVFAKCAFEIVFGLEAPVNATPIGGDWTDPTYARLKYIFDDDDAEHIVHALRAKCDYFMTLDQKTILHRAMDHAEEVASICGQMLLLSPRGVVKEIENKRSSAQ